MKKIFKFIWLSVLTLVMFGFAACGVYTPPSTGDNPDDGTGVIDPAPDTPVTPEEDAFTVTLLWNGDNYDMEAASPVDVTGIQVEWTDLETGEKFRAKFNEDGVASRDDLDGDFQVTIVNPPDGFTYNPNIYKATNAAKNISITLYELTPIFNNGVDPYNDVIEITHSGAYRITLESGTHKIWCRVVPWMNGVYSMESLVDVTANKINPLLNIFTGTIGLVNEASRQEIDGGGAENTFTKNFRWEINVAAEEVGNVFYFMITSTNNDLSAYPIDVDFILDRNGDFTYDRDPIVMVTPEHDFESDTWVTPEGNFTYCAYRPGLTVPKLMDSSKVGLNPEDGFYHYYNEATGKYDGDMLFAMIDNPTEVVSKSFTNKGPGMGSIQISQINNKNYTSFINDYYAEYANTDGCYPVTEELRVFLQEFALSQQLFNDGNGMAETNNGYQSDEDSMWMFACGYYA